MSEAKDVNINHFFTAASKTLLSDTSVENPIELIGKTDYYVFYQELADQYFKHECLIFDYEYKALT